MGFDDVGYGVPPNSRRQAFVPLGEAYDRPFAPGRYRLVKEVGDATLYGAFAFAVSDPPSFLPKGDRLAHPAEEEGAR